MVSLAAFCRRSYVGWMICIFGVLGGSSVLAVRAGFAQTKSDQKSKAEKSQPAAATADQKSTSSDESQNPEDKPFKGMKYRLIGPFRGGRVLTGVGIPGDPTTYYFGGTGGGVWKSTDGAMTWSSVFDKEGTSAIGSVAVADSNPNILYVGTGEACIRGNISKATACTSRWTEERIGKT